MELEPIAPPPKLRPILSNQHTLPTIILEKRIVLKNTAVYVSGKISQRLVMMPAGLFYSELDNKELESAEKITLGQRVKLTTTIFRLIYECTLS